MFGTQAITSRQWVKKHILGKKRDRHVLEDGMIASGLGWCKFSFDTEQQISSQQKSSKRVKHYEIKKSEELIDLNIGYEESTEDSMGIFQCITPLEKIN